MIVFFVGTAAELVKLAPVIREVRARDARFVIASSGQNDLRGSELWALANVDGPDVILRTDPIPPRASGLAAFLAKASVTGRRDLAALIRGVSPSRTRGVVHGDTVSTLLGAGLFRSLGVPIHHVEAGLRSFRLTQPFPEEICRVLVSRVARVAYCPNEWAAGHLHRPGLEKIITGGNTLYDALALAMPEGEDPDAPSPLAALEAEHPGLREPYFVLVVHRQENLLGTSRTTLLRSIVERVRARRDRPRCLFVMHALTRAALERAGLLDELERDPSFLLLPRQPYVTFTRVLARAEYLITDGGSNQEEAHYLGKPCLLMRRVTERIEGLGENVLLAPEPLAEIDAFMADPARYRRPRVHLPASPSAVIAAHLTS